MRQIKQKSKLYACEIEVLYWAAQGKTSYETSLILGLTQHTVNSYRKNAIFKLEASNVVHAVYKAYFEGIIV